MTVTHLMVAPDELHHTIKRHITSSGNSTSNCSSPVKKTKSEKKNKKLGKQQKKDTKVIKETKKRLIS